MCERCTARGIVCPGCGGPLNSIGMCAADEAPPTPERPLYRKVAHDDSGATELWFITCDEGWRVSIVCERMYEPVADWLLRVLGHRPFSTVSGGISLVVPPGRAPRE